MIRRPQHILILAISLGAMCAAAWLAAGAG